MIYIPNVRAIKGTAPTALDMNSLSNNLDFLNGRRVHRNCSLNISSNQTVAMSALTGLGTLSFNSSILDDSSMFSGGVLTPPSDTQFIRLSLCIATSALISTSLGVYPANYLHELAGSDVGRMYQSYQITKDTAATWGGLRTVFIDMGWMQYDSAITNYQNVSLGSTASVTILQNDSTWLSVEVI